MIDRVTERVNDINLDERVVRCVRNGNGILSAFVSIEIRVKLNISI